MNKKVITPLIIVLVLTLIAAAIVYAPNLVDLMLRMHGMR